MKQWIKKLARAAGYDIVRYTPPHLGVDPLSDMSRFVRTKRPTIFDVGANVGQSIVAFRERFPNCVIHSFEPSPATFDLLMRNVGSSRDVYLWNLALGASEGTQKLYENSCSDMSSFLPLGAMGWGTVTAETAARVETLDRFVKENNIAHIDILKSDTQGFDLNVLKGARKSIKSGMIDQVFVEINFVELYSGIPGLSEIYDFLLSSGYSLISFYKVYHKSDLAAWTDAAFVRKAHYESLSRAG